MRLVERHCEHTDNHVMTCCFDDEYLTKDCEFITFWLFSEESAMVRRIWEVQSRIV